MNNRSIRHAALAAVLAAGTLVPPAHAQQEVALLALPDAPAWGLGRSFVAAFNAGDRQGLEAYLRAHLSETALRHESAADRAQALLQQRRELGSLETIEVSGVPYALVLSTRGSARGAGADILILVDALDAGRADDLRVHPGAL